MSQGPESDGRQSHALVLASSGTSVSLLVGRSTSASFDVPPRISWMTSVRPSMPPVSAYVPPGFARQARSLPRRTSTTV
jgi:hypothetical protein